MFVKIGDEFKGVCEKIVNQRKSPEEWAKIESDDMFQGKGYEGGFDATEMAFCFSIYKDDKEYWLQLSLDEVKSIADGKVTQVNVKPPETVR